MAEPSSPTPQALIDTYVRTHLLGRERELDVPTEPPLAAYEGWHALGFNNWWLPRDVGGRGLSLRESVDLVGSLAYGDPGVAFTALISILGTTIVDLFGSAEQRRRYLTPLPGKPRYAALAASERAAGSELLRMDAIATRTEDGYVLEGPKFFCTNAAFADFVVVVARVPGKPRDDYKAFVVEQGTPGLTVARRWNTNGLRASATYELSLSGCRVREDAVLSGHGLRALEVSLNPSRILIASLGIGIASRLRDLCLQYARQKTVREQPLLSHATFAAKLGQMEMEIESIRAICRTAASEFDEAVQNDRPRLLRTGALKSAVVAKMLSGQLTWGIASVASEAFGGLGYTDESPVGKLVRDARMISIIEAGDDVLRDLLYSRYVLKRLDELGG
jgi:alkylation response protein AidB-like acyl-CoA dehydrogenase